MGECEYRAIIMDHLLGINLNFLDDNEEEAEGETSDATIKVLLTKPVTRLGHALIIPIAATIVEPSSNDPATKIEPSSAADPNKEIKN